MDEDLGLMLKALVQARVAIRLAEIAAGRAGVHPRLVRKMQDAKETLLAVTREIHDGPRGGRR